MANRAGTATAAGRADYLGGDPIESSAIEGGRLDVHRSGLRFSGPAGAELRLPLDDLLGISLSGRAVESRHRRAIHGTMRIAGLRGTEPTEWLFAIDRSAASALRRRVDRELASRGRSPLPFVEELDGFPLHRRSARPTEGPAGAPHLQLKVAELGHMLASADARKHSPSRRRILPWVLLGAALIAAEVIVPLILLRGG